MTSQGNLGRTVGGQRRKSAGKRWSANSTVQWLDTAGGTVRRDPDAADRPLGAVKARVHYRLDGKTKRPTFPAATDSDLETLRAFTATLQLAYLANWPADTNGKPTPPIGLTLRAEHGCVENGRDPTEQSSEAGAPRGRAEQSSTAYSLRLPSVPTEVLDSVRLVALFQQHQWRTPKRRGGGKRGRNTRNNYRTHHDFFLAHARYKLGDPRLAIVGRQAGDPWVFDNPEAPIRPADLLGLVRLRATTNLRIRGVNERRLAKWDVDRAAAESTAAGESAPVQAPPIPEMLPETTSARTVEAFGQQLGAMLEYAYKYELISTRLWTETVKDEVPHAAATGYTARTVIGRSQVAQIVAEISTTTRKFRSRSGEAQVVTGERYAAMVWLAGRLAPRPEEVIAIRDSWVILDPHDPRVVLHHAEVIAPALDGMPRERIETPLKHRVPGQARVLRPDPSDRREFLEVMSAHRSAFVDPDGDPDQHFFTTETGRPVDLSNFNDNWWVPARDAVFGDHPRFASLPFRRLRAAAITDWLVVLGWSTQRAADMAGHSQAVLEKHYKGVLDAASQGDSAPPTTDVIERRAVTEAPTQLPKDVDKLSDAELVYREQLLRSQMKTLRVEYEQLQAEQRQRFDALGG